MNAAMLTVLVLALLLFAVPMPSTEIAEKLLAPGESITFDIDSGSGLYLAYTVTADAPIDVLLTHDGETVLEDHSSLSVRRSVFLPNGSYVLTIASNWSSGAKVDYRIYLDHEVLGGLTAKNVLVLSIAAAIGVAAAVRLARRK
jgi:hypothetical protein